MSQLGDRVRELRESQNMTQTELAEMLGMKTYTTVSKWEKNENFPKGKDLKRLAQIFSVTSDYLLGLSDDKFKKFSKDIASDVSEITSIYTKLETDRQIKVIDFASEQLEQQNQGIVSSIFDKLTKEDDEEYMTDFAEGVVAAGHGAFQEDNLHMEVRLRASKVPENYDTIATVVGDSMEPLIKNNDLLFIEVTSQVDANSIGVFQVNGKNFVKKLKRDYGGAWYLQSLNNNYEEIHLSENDDIRTIGEVISIYRED
ncbi:helix-turn-helix domain-containing protein [Streptococcus dysgalactiae]|uniref:Cro/CI family transcriptional regulator n=2 Tax=Streptococcus dysgalactiae TaxID=1334 RepID=A0AAE9QVB4_STREQ|nr:XRE family transcriptional regulator [Streptococcus dysgalactiae]EGL49134.1 peptidase S24-like protein [Streptococcus dysgalactiae subsp. equisimilis SK1249]HEQ2314242.1 helix-turn-helix transcriptional regulator [Streptococcus pyogenes]MDQ0263230.1 phage repressor protein C with HTH and peptisase S24 domain [Streptococcus dysgalactiae]OBY96716.1 repressor [Streptococcus dysgalactiae subsp. equisimilis]QJD61087.1 helix-turn-helix transcriptional regulator [Streptococcus dysgalactiae subsp. 